MRKARISFGFLFLLIVVFSSCSKKDTNEFNAHLAEQSEDIEQVIPLEEDLQEDNFEYRSSTNEKNAPVTNGFSAPEVADEPSIIGTQETEPNGDYFIVIIDDISGAKKIIRVVSGFVAPENGTLVQRDIQITANEEIATAETAVTNPGGN